MENAHYNKVLSGDGREITKKYIKSFADREKLVTKVLLLYEEGKMIWDLIVPIW